MIVGFTGRYAAGKTEACKYLQGKGFDYYSLSDAIREEADRRGLDHGRENMIRLGNELRKNNGPGILGARIKEMVEESEKEDFAIDSIRSPFEVEELRKLDDFTLIGITAPIEIRFERLKKRGREGDPDSLEELKRSEAKENINSDSNQQLDATLKKADIVIENDGSLEELHQKIEDRLGGV